MGALFYSGLLIDRLLHMFPPFTHAEAVACQVCGSKQLRWWNRRSKLPENVTVISKYVAPSSCPSLSSNKNKSILNSLDYGMQEPPCARGMQAAFVTPFASAIAMTGRRVNRNNSRPVFLAGAVQRVSRQKSARARARSVYHIARFLLSDVWFWVSEGLWHVPGTLACARARQRVTFASGGGADVYWHAAHEAYSEARVLGEDSKTEAPLTPVVVYVHGGAWGAGESYHFSQLAMRVVQEVRATVIVASYRLYPDGDIDDQVADVREALLYARDVFPGRRIVLYAHSSGAQVSALALLRASEEPGKPLADVAVLSAGPYHLGGHYLYESARGIANVSPMLPAAHAETDPAQFDKRSPTLLTEGLDSALREAESGGDELDALEGDMQASHIAMAKASKDATSASSRQFPKTYIMTASCDTIVPMYSSIRFCNALRRTGVNARLLVYDFTDHKDFVTDWFTRAAPRELYDILDVSTADEHTRLSYARRIQGSAYAAMLTDRFRTAGPAAHVRDALRIFSAAGGSQ